MNLSAPRRRPQRFAALLRAGLALLLCFAPVGAGGALGRRPVPSGERGGAELTWSPETRAPAGDLLRAGERPTTPAVRPRRGPDRGAWKLPTAGPAVLASLLSPPAGATNEDTPTPPPASAGRRPLAPRAPRGPPIS